METLETRQLLAADVAVKQFNVDPVSLKLNVGYEVSSSLPASDYAIKIYQSLDGVTPLSAAIHTQVIDNDHYSGSFSFTPQFSADSYDDYYLIAVAEYPDSVPSNNTMPFAGGAFKDASGVVNYHGPLGNTSDNVQVVYSDGMYKVQRYQGGNWSTLLQQSSSYAFHAWGHGGNDSLAVSASGVQARLFGGAGDDSISGYSGNDFLAGGAGNDVIYGGGGNDLLYGGDNDDDLYGGSGRDILYGEAGNDDLYGGSEDDILIQMAGTGTLEWGVGQGVTPDKLWVTTASNEYENLGSPGFSVDDLSLREALLVAYYQAGTDAIEFAANVNANVELSGNRIVVDSNVVIKGRGASTTVIDANGLSGVLYVLPGVTATLEDLKLTGGGGESEGGGIFSSGHLTLNRVEVSGNSSSGTGGGITSRNYTSTGINALYINDSTIVDNHSMDGSGLAVVATAGAGGAFGAFEIRRSTIANNTTNVPLTSWSSGGGLTLVGSPSSVRIENSTFSGNSAQYTGGIRLWNVATPMYILNSTVVNNFGLESGGLQLFVNSTSPIVHNTIIAGNKTHQNPATNVDVWGAINATSSNNILAAGSGSTALTGQNNNKVGVPGNPIDPKLAPLGNYGGPTQTHLVLPGSPALGAANVANSLSTDQRGNPRAGSPDIGAVEISLPGSITLSPQGLLTIDDSQSNVNLVTLSVATVGPTKYIVVNGVNLNPVSFNPSNVKQVVIQGASGDSIIDLSQLQLTSFPNLLTDGITVNGGSGNDSIKGSVYNDVISGGSGNDTIWGGAGHDTLNGESGRDYLFGEAGNDVLDEGLETPPPVGLGAGAYSIVDGGLGDDRYVFGNPYSLAGTLTVDFADEGGVDTLDFSGMSILAGGNGVEIFTDYGNEPHTLFFVANIAGSGIGDFEHIIGSPGNDILSGNLLDNIIDGGAGNDVLSAGAGGNDELIGGAGNDTFAMGDNQQSPTSQYITIRDSSGSDQIDFTAVTTPPVGVDLVHGKFDYSRVVGTIASGDHIELAVGLPQSHQRLVEVNLDEDFVSQSLELLQLFRDLGLRSTGLNFQVLSNSNSSLVSASISAGANQALSLTSIANKSGTAEIKVRGVDSTAAQATITFVIHVAAANDRPTSTSISNQSINANTTGSYVDLSLASYFSDVDLPYGDHLTYVVAYNDRSDLVQTSFPNPVGNPALLRMQAVSHQGGQVRLVVRATDQAGLSTEQSILVTVTATANTAPTATPFSLLSLNYASGLQIIDLYPKFADSQSPDNHLAYRISATQNGVLFKTLEIDPTGRYLRLEIDPDKTNLGADVNRSSGGAILPFTGAVTITATDPAGLSVTNTLNVTVTPVDLPATIAVSLANDTGVSATDLTTGDPTLSLLVRNDDEVLVENSTDADDVFVDIAKNSTGTIVYSAKTDGLGRLQYTPPGLTAGATTFYVRTRETDDVNGGSITSSWTPITITLQSGINALPGLTLSLLNDTDLGSTLTADPTIRGQVTNDGRIEGLLVELDYDNNFSTIEATALTDGTGRFVYTPAIPSGVRTIRGRVAELNYATGGTSYGPASPATLTFNYDPNASNDAPTVDIEWDDTSPYSPFITGSVTNDGEVANLSVNLKVSWNDGGPKEINVTLTPDALGNFSFRPTGLPFGVSITASAIVVEAGNQEGNDSSYLYIAEPSGLVLQLQNDTGYVGDGSTYDPRITATLGSYPNLQFDFDVNGDGIADGSAKTNNAGVLVFDPPHLAAGSVTVKMRLSNFGTAMAKPSDWTAASFTFTYQPWSGASVNLTAPDSDGDANNGFASADPRITGIVAGPFSEAYATIEFDFDNDGLADDVTTADGQGSFTYIRSTTPGTYALRARATSQNGLTGEFTTGAWSSVLSFTVLAAVGPAVSQLGLVNETDGPGQTTDPTLEGQIGSLGAYPHVEVELDYDGDLQADDFTVADASGHFQITPVGLLPGFYEVRARSKVYDATLQRYVSGEWSVAPNVVEFTLLADMGDDAPETPEADEAFEDAAGMATSAAGAYAQVIDAVVDAFNDEYHALGLALNPSGSGFNLLFLDYRPLFNSHGGTVSGPGQGGAQNGSLPVDGASSPFDAHTLAAAPAVGVKQINNLVVSIANGGSILSGNLEIDFRLEVLANSTFTISLDLTLYDFHYHASATPSQNLATPGLHVYENSPAAAYELTFDANGSFSSSGGVIVGAGDIADVNETGLYKIAVSTTAPYLREEGGKTATGSTVTTVNPNAPDAGQSYDYAVAYTGGEFTATVATRSVAVDYEIIEGAAYRIDLYTQAAVTSSTNGSTGTLTKTGVLKHQFDQTESGAILFVNGALAIDATFFDRDDVESYWFTLHEQGSFEYEQGGFSDEGTYVIDENGSVVFIRSEGGEYDATGTSTNADITDLFYYENGNYQSSSTVYGRYVESGGIDSSSGNYQSAAGRGYGWSYEENGDYDVVNGDLHASTVSFALLESGTAYRTFKGTGDVEAGGSDPRHGKYGATESHRYNYSLNNSGSYSNNGGVELLQGEGTISRSSAGMMTYDEDGDLDPYNDSYGDYTHSRSASLSGTYGEERSYSSGAAGVWISGDYSVADLERSTLSGRAHVTQEYATGEDRFTLVADVSRSATYDDSGRYTFDDAELTQIGRYQSSAYAHEYGEETVYGEITHADGVTYFHNENVRDTASWRADHADYYTDSSTDLRDGILSNENTTFINVKKDFWSNKEAATTYSERTGDLQLNIERSSSDFGFYTDDNGDRTVDGWFESEKSTYMTQSISEAGDRWGLTLGGFENLLERTYDAKYEETDGEFVTTPSGEYRDANFLKHEESTEKITAQSISVYAQTYAANLKITESYSLSLTSGSTLHDDGHYTEDSGNPNEDTTFGDYWTSDHGALTFTQSYRENYRQGNSPAFYTEGVLVRTQNSDSSDDYHESGSYTRDDYLVEKGKFTRDEHGSVSGSLSNTGIWVEGTITSSYTETISNSILYDNHENGKFDEEDFDEYVNFDNHFEYKETQAFDKHGPFNEWYRQGAATMSQSSTRTSMVDDAGYFSRNAGFLMFRHGTLTKRETREGDGGYTMTAKYIGMQGDVTGKEHASELSSGYERYTYDYDPFESVQHTTSGTFEFKSTFSSTFYSNEDATSDHYKIHSKESRSKHHNYSLSYYEHGDFEEASDLSRRSLTADFERVITSEQREKLRQETKQDLTASLVPLGVVHTSGQAVRTTGGLTTMTQSASVSSSYSEKGNLFHNGFGYSSRAAAFTEDYKASTSGYEKETATSSLYGSFANNVYLNETNGFYRQTATHSQHEFDLSRSSYHATGTYVDVADDGNLETKHADYSRSQTSSYSQTISNSYSDTWLATTTITSVASTESAMYRNWETQTNSLSSVTRYDNGVYSLSPNGYEADQNSMTIDRSISWSISQSQTHNWGRYTGDGSGSSSPVSATSNTASYSHNYYENLSGTYHETGNYNASGFGNSKVTLNTGTYSSTFHDTASRRRASYDDRTMTTTAIETQTADHHLVEGGTYSPGNGLTTSATLNEDNWSSYSVSTHWVQSNQSTLNAISKVSEYITIQLITKTNLAETITGHRITSSSWFSQLTLYPNDVQPAFSDSDPGTTMFIPQDDAGGYYDNPITPPPVDSSWTARQWTDFIIEAGGFVPGPIGSIFSVAQGILHIYDGNPGQAIASFASAATGGAAKYVRLAAGASKVGLTAMKGVAAGLTQVPRKFKDMSVARRFGQEVWDGVKIHKWDMQDKADYLSEVYLGQAFGAIGKWKDGEQPQNPQLGVCFVAGTRILVVETKPQQSSLASTTETVSSGGERQGNAWIAAVAIAAGVGGLKQMRSSKAGSQGNKKMATSKKSKRRRDSVDDKQRAFAEDWGGARLGSAAPRERSYSLQATPGLSEFDEALAWHDDRLLEHHAISPAATAIEVTGRSAPPADSLTKFAAPARLNSISEPSADGAIQAFDGRHPASERAGSRRERLRKWSGAAMLASSSLLVAAFLGSSSYFASFSNPPSAAVQAAPASLALNAEDSRNDGPGTTMKPIEEIAVGDVVLTRDDANSPPRERKVVRTFKRESDHLRVIEIRGSDDRLQQIQTTDEHPFWVQGVGWRPAGTLQVNDPLAEQSGTTAVVAATRREDHPEGIVVYNFEVEGSHSYFVAGNNASSEPLLVHNQCTVAVYVPPRNNQTVSIAGAYNMPSRVGNPSRLSSANFTTPLSLTSVIPSGNYAAPSGVQRDLAQTPRNGDFLLSTDWVNEPIGRVNKFSDDFVEVDAPNIAIGDPHPQNGGGKFRMTNSQ